jgi:hypothetical protein
MEPETHKGPRHELVPPIWGELVDLGDLKKLGAYLNGHTIAE